MMAPDMGRGLQQNVRLRHFTGHTNFLIKKHIPHKVISISQYPADPRAVGMSGPPGGRAGLAQDTGMNARIITANGKQSELNQDASDSHVIRAESP